ncbi:MAG: helix-turn-helix domain-containing protein [Gaiellaceae bacterium]
MRGFTQVANSVLLDNSLSHGARFTYTLLRLYAWQDEECFPGQETLAHAMGVHVRTVRRYLCELQDACLVESLQQGHGRTNRYRLKIRPDTSVLSDRTSMSAHDRTPMSGPIEKKTQVKKTQVKKTQVKKTQRTAPQGARAAHHHTFTPAKKKLVTDFVNSARAEGLDPNRDLIGRVGREIRQALEAGDPADAVSVKLDGVAAEVSEAGEEEGAEDWHTALRDVFGYTPGRDFKPTVWKRDVGLTAEDKWKLALQSEEAGR